MTDGDDVFKHIFHMFLELRFHVYGVQCKKILNNSLKYSTIVSVIFLMLLVICRQRIDPEAISADLKGR